MPDLGALDAELAGLQRDAFDPSTQPGAFGSFTDSLSDFGDLGLGSLDAIFDLLDRPGRAFRLALAGEGQQAFGALATPFLPKSAEDFFGIEESKPFSGEQLLERLNVGGLDTQIGGGFTTGDVQGFVAEVVLDPLLIFGGPLGRAAGRASQAAARGATQVLEGLAGKTGRASTLFKRLPRSGVQFAEAKADEVLARARKFGVNPGVLDEEGVQLVSTKMLRRVVKDLPESADDALRADVLERGIVDPIEVTVDRASGFMRVETGQDLLKIADDLDIKRVPVRIREGTLPGVEAEGVVAGFQTGAGEALLTAEQATAAGIRRLSKNSVKRLKKKAEGEAVTASDLGFRVSETATTALTTAEKVRRSGLELSLAPLARLGEKAAKAPVGIGGALRQGAKAALSGTELINKHFALRNVRMGQRFAALAGGALGRERVAIAQLRERSKKILSLLDTDIKNQAARDFLEQPGAREIFAQEVLKADPEKLFVSGGEPLKRFVERTGKLADDFRQQIKEMDDDVREAIGLYAGGGKGGKKLIPGKIGREEELIERSILHRNLIEEFVKTNNLGHLKHVRAANPTTGEELFRALMADFRSMVDPKSIEGLTDIEVARRAGEIAGRITRASNLTKARKIAGSLTDLEKEFPGLFELSLGKINFAEGIGYQAAITADDILRGVSGVSKWMRRGTMNPEAAQAGWVALDATKLPKAMRAPFLDDAGKAVPMMVRSEIHEALFSSRGVINQMMKRGQTSEFRKTWRKLTSVWKGWTLGPFPSWFTRNLVGNVWLNHLAGVRNPSHYLNGRKVQRAVANILKEVPDDKLLDEVITLGGEAVKIRDLASDVIEQGVVQGGFYTSDIGEGFFKALDSPNMAKRLFSLDPQQSMFARYGFSINAAIEDNARVAHFMQRRGAGLNAEEAALSVKAHLFDFENLTAFEQETMRDLIPFYSWFRQNMPTQIQALVTAPQRVAFLGRTKIQLDAEQRAQVPDSLFPEWVMSGMPLMMGFDKKKPGDFRVWMLNNWIPMADLTEIESPAELFRFALNSAHPLIREVLQQGINYDTYFKRAIQKYPYEKETLFGIPVNKRFSHLMRNIRMINELDRNLLPLLGFKTGSRRNQELLAELSGPEKVARATLGLKARRINVPQNQQFKVRNLERQIRTAKSRLKFAVRSQDLANAQVLQAEILDLEDELRFSRQAIPHRHPAMLPED